jgi:hypothetical protein
MSNQPNHAATWPVTCDLCGEVHLVADPLRPTCGTCEAELRAMFADASREIPTDDEADRYEAEMERRVSR